MENLISSKDLFLPHVPINFYFNNSSIVNSHKHLDFYEIFIITNGSVKHTFNTKTHNMNTLDYCIVRPNDKHSFVPNRNEGSIQHLNIRILPNALTKECAEIDNKYMEYINNLEYPVNHLSVEKYKQIEYWVQYALVATEESKKNLSLKNIIRLFLSFFYENVNMTNTRFPTWFNKLILEINKPYFISKSAKDIYTAANYSSNYVIKAFKKYLNTTPVKYLNSLKYNYACNLLTNTDYTIIYISNEIGFTTASYFVSFFKKLAGCSPSEYREKYKL